MNYQKIVWWSIKNIFNYSGRSSRKEFWLFVLAASIVNLIGGLFITVGLACHEFLGYAITLAFILILLIETLVYFSLIVRRFHDIGLSGFWVLYLNPFFGLPLLYVIYLLDIDRTCLKLIENNIKVGSPWLGWILTLLLWPLGVLGALFLLFLYPGKKEANEFGPVSEY